MNNYEIDKKILCLMEEFGNIVERKDLKKKTARADILAMEKLNVLYKLNYFIDEIIGFKNLKSAVIERLCDNLQALCMSSEENAQVKDEAKRIVGRLRGDYPCRKFVVVKD